MLLDFVKAWTHWLLEAGDALWSVDIDGLSLLGIYVGMGILSIYIGYLKRDVSK